MPKGSPDPRKNKNTQLGSTSEGYPMPDVTGPMTDRNSVDESTDMGGMGYANSADHSSIPARPDKTS